MEDIDFVNLPYKKQSELIERIYKAIKVDYESNGYKNIKCLEELDQYEKETIDKINTLKFIHAKIVEYGNMSLKMICEHEWKSTGYVRIIRIGDIPEFESEYRCKKCGSIKYSKEGLLEIKK